VEKNDIKDVFIFLVLPFFSFFPPEKWKKIGENMYVCLFMRYFRYLDGDKTYLSLFKRIHRILSNRNATFDTMELEEEEGKAMCDAVAAGQLALAFKIAKPGVTEFPVKLFSVV
jgi:hypothetical protein